MRGFLPNDLFSIFTEVFDLSPRINSDTLVKQTLPAVDMYEEGDTLVIRLELPGYTEKDVNISVQNNSVRIWGQKKKEQSKKERRYFMKEIFTTSFNRTISLPYPVDEAKAEAYFEDGYLVIRLPRLTTDKKRGNIIPIKRKK